jgi:hypothetical protein
LLKVFRADRVASEMNRIGTLAGKAAQPTSRGRRKSSRLSTPKPRIVRLRRRRRPPW